MQYDLKSASKPPLQDIGSAEDFIYRNDAIYMPICHNDLRIQILDLRCITHSPDWTVKENVHPWYEFNYVSDGSVYTCIDGVEFLAEKGSFFLVPPKVRHSHRHHDHTGDAGFCLRFVLEQITPPAATGVYPIAQQVINSLSGCKPGTYYFPADKLLRSIERSTELQFPAAFVSWLLQIQSCIAPGAQAPVAGTHGARNEGIVRQIDLYLESFFAERFLPAELAGSLNYSYRHLSRVYKETTGCTITERLNRIRMQKAAQLLTDTTLSMHAVSEAVGFSSYANFFKVFEKIHGCTPSEFRR